MKLWNRLTVLGGVLALVASTAALAHAATGPAAARGDGSAGAGTLDPRHLPAVLPHGVFRATGTPAAAEPVRPRAAAGITTTNPLIRSDLAIYVSDSSTYTSLAAEGHLYLTNDTGSHFAGTFVDDLDGAVGHTASANHIEATGFNGTYSLYTGSGHIVFTIGPGGITSTLPSSYGPGAKISTILYGTHAWTQHPPLTASLSTFTTGDFHPPASGTLTLTTDALGFVVPFSTSRHVNSSWTYTVLGHLHTFKIASFGRYYEPDGAGNGSLTTQLQVGATTFSVVDAKEDTAGTKYIAGNALAGLGKTVSQSTFSAH